MSAIRSVRFDYFQIWCNYENKNGENTECVFDLVPLLQKLKELPSTKTTYNYYGETARVQKIELDRSTGIWEMHLVRIRKNMLPGIATDGGDFHTLPLEEDEGVAEEISVLYEPTKSIIMIRRNRYSLSPTGLCNYFTSMITGYILEFKPIITKSAMNKVKNAAIHTKVVVAFENIDYDKQDSSSVNKIVQSAAELSARNAQVVFSIGRSIKMENSFNRRKFIESLEHLLSRKDVKKIQVSERDSDDCATEVVDLIEQHVYDKAEISYSRNEPITHERVYKYMLEKFDDRKDQLISLVS